MSSGPDWAIEMKIEGFGWKLLLGLPYTIDRGLVTSVGSVTCCSVVSLTGSPTIVSRKEWGASSLTCRVPLSLPVPYLIIEQVTRMQCQDQTSCSQVLRVLQSHYVHNKGWCDVAFK